MSSTTPFSLLGEPAGGPSGKKDQRDTRERLYELAQWICDPGMLIRRTDSIEFTDLTTISHRTRLEFPDGRWPYPVPYPPGTKPGKDDPASPLGLIFLGFMRRGMPLQHSKVTMFEGGEQYELTRLKLTDTEHLAVLLLDAVWLSCSVNELNGIPRPLEAESREPLKRSPDDRFNISPFWQEFLGIRGRNVNPDWDLLKTRFELSESGWANEIWRPPSANEPKWSYERALLAKLCSKLAFSYIAAAWVPANALDGTDGPFEVEVEFQERVLRPKEQVERIRAVRRRSKKAFERSLLQLDEREADERCSNLDRADLTPESLDTDLWRLDNVPETYLGLLDPALDDPDARKPGRQRPDREEPVNQLRKQRESKGPGWVLAFGVPLLLGVIGVSFLGVPSPFSGVGSTFLWAGAILIAGFTLLGVIRHFRIIRAWLLRNWRQLLFPAVLLAVVISYLGWIWPPPPGPFLNFVIPGLDLPLIPFVLVGAYALARVTRFLRWARRETMVLPTWSAGPTSIVYEVSCPPEFTVWQGILARPSRRGRCWRTRPASELGRRAHLWWSEPNDRGWMEESPEDRPQLLVLELRARLSSSITLIGAFLALATAILLAGPATVLLHDLFPSLNVSLIDLEQATQGKNVGSNSFVLSADFIATVLLILPTVGAAILIRPGEDPIARKLLTWDRFVIALSTVVPAVIAVSLLLVFGWWWTPETGDDVFLWTIWFWLGLFSFVCSAILFLAWTQTQGSETPAPSARQGGFPPYPNPRRRPLDVAAPLRPLSTMKGRLTAERHLLRLAPNRSRRNPRPNYSLVLPAEGSRIYTPAAPTILCLVERGADGAMDQEDLDRFISGGLNRLSEPGFTRGVRNTNTIGWQPGVFSVVPNPISDKPYLLNGSDEEQTQMLLHLLRLQKANARPSRSKPIGNGGGLVPLTVPDLPSESGDSLKEVLKAKFEETGLFDLQGGDQMDYDNWRRRKVTAMVGRRALLDVDGVILIPKSVVDKFVEESGDWDLTKLTLRNMPKLAANARRFAGEEARKAGTGPGAHVWPSSFEPPLAGESWSWSGLGSLPSHLSLRPFLFKWSKPSEQSSGIWERGRYLLAVATQGLFFDQGLRKIPVTQMEIRETGENGQRSFSDFLLSIPRVFGGVETEDRNKRVQRILWFGQPEANQGDSDRACPVKLQIGTARKGNIDCVRRVTDVVGHRVWVWNQEVGMDHRNFEFRNVKPSDYEASLDAEGQEPEKVGRATPSWDLGKEPADIKEHDDLVPSFELSASPEKDEKEKPRRRRIVGRFITSDDVVCAGLGEKSPGLTVVGWLDPRHSKRLTSDPGNAFEAVSRAGSDRQSVWDEIRRMKKDGHTGPVILEQDPWPWRGGVPAPPPRDVKVEPLVILIGGIVASGKSELARRLRTRLEQDDGSGTRRWEVIRNDPSHNLFFQIHDFDQNESMDEQEGLNFARDHGDPLSQRLTELVQRTYLLESMSEFDRAYSHSKGYRGGLIVEYWPSFSVRAMAGVQRDRGLSSAAYSKLSAELEHWEKTSDAWPDDWRSRGVPQPLVLRIDSEISTCVLRAVERAHTRHGEKVGARYLERLKKEVDKVLPATGRIGVSTRSYGRSSTDPLSVPDGSSVTPVEDDKTKYFSVEVDRLTRRINKIVS